MIRSKTQNKHLYFVACFFGRAAVIFLHRAGHQKITR
jgi:hypothetical protein